MENVNVDGAKRIAKAAKFAQVPQLIHVSCMKAHATAASKFLQLKAQADAAVRLEFPEATIVKPSVLYGNEDRFTNCLGMLANLGMGIPVLRGHEKRIMYPLYVGDAAYGIMQLMADDAASGKTYQFAGPVAYDWPKIIDLFGRMTLRPTNLLPVNLPVFR